MCIASAVSTTPVRSRYVALAAGVLLTERYAATGGDLWALSNIHGDILATTDRAGNLNALPAIYDPYGNPLSTTTGVVDLTADPTTRTNGLTDGWEGSHQRGAEHAGSANWILMGARVYLPGSGQFTSTDPVFGGNVNPYTYPADPINGFDLTGLKKDSWYKKAWNKTKSLVYNHRRDILHIAITIVVGAIAPSAAAFCGVTARAGCLIAAGVAVGMLVGTPTLLVVDAAMGFTPTGGEAALYLVGSGWAGPRSGALAYRYYGRVLRVGPG